MEILTELSFVIFIFISAFFIGKDYEKYRKTTRFNVMKLAINELEKYEEMWEEFKKEYGEEYIQFEGGDEVKTAMNKFEEKYLSLVTDNINHG